jgi:hypothetical protein
MYEVTGSTKVLEKASEKLTLFQDGKLTLMAYLCKTD